MSYSFSNKFNFFKLFFLNSNLEEYFLLKKLILVTGGIQMNKDTKVKCDVESCKYNDCNCCNLEVLDISCTCNGCDCSDIEETICRSFSKKDG